MDLTVEGKRQLRVLVIEDNLPDAQLCLVELRKDGFEVVADVVSARKELEDRLAGKDYDVILADYRLNGWTGMDALALVQERGKDIPFLLVTGALGEETAVECLKQGVSDYVLKERLARLPLVVRRALEERVQRSERARTEQALREANQQLSYLAIRDSLTGLFNRRYMEDSLDRELHRAIRKQRPLGLIVLDVDYFKGFNDLYGHEAGDALLRKLGYFLQEHTRQEDIACRYGGEEFVLILPEVTLDVTRNRAEELRARVKNLRVQYRGHALGTVTLSLGVAACPDHGSTASALLRAADVVLYRAKSGGRDRVVVGPLCGGQPPPLPRHASQSQ